MLLREFRIYGNYKMFKGNRPNLNLDKFMCHTDVRVLNFEFSFGKI